MISNISYTATIYWLSNARIMVTLINISNRMPNQFCTITCILTIQKGRFLCYDYADTELNIQWYQIKEYVLVLYEYLAYDILKNIFYESSFYQILFKWRKNVSNQHLENHFSDEQFAAQWSIVLWSCNYIAQGKKSESELSIQNEIIMVFMENLHLTKIPSK